MQGSPESFPPCSLCRHENGTWCNASKLGMAYKVEERKYGLFGAVFLGHCGKMGLDFVAKVGA
jgi:hypothetical protein